MKLARVNTCLLVAIILVCGYIILMPIVPMVSFWIAGRGGTRLQTLTARLHIPAARVSSVPADNRLIVPSMLLDTPINEGTSAATLRNGTWRRPLTSTPDKGGNTVIVAHRFTYADPRGTFYYLNKVAVGDEIGIFWHRKRYVYKVANVATVPANQVSVEAATQAAQLTLYTCTPLWLPKDRLVVTAKLEKS
ncbi:MAG TPA: class E sortase [Bacillota bacterium]|nr:class E sortase [Bacillota bacterium]